MPTERRIRNRRTSPGTCVTCQHLRGDHLENTTQCLIEGCTCEQFVEVTERPEPKPRKKSVARKKR